LSSLLFVVLVTIAAITVITSHRSAVEYARHGPASLLNVQTARRASKASIRLAFVHGSGAEHNRSATAQPIQPYEGDQVFMEALLQTSRKQFFQVLILQIFPIFR